MCRPYRDSFAAVTASSWMCDVATLDAASGPLCLANVRLVVPSTMGSALALESTHAVPPFVLPPSTYTQSPIVTSASAFASDARVRTHGFDPSPSCVIT